MKRHVARWAVTGAICTALAGAAAAQPAGGAGQGGMGQGGMGQGGMGGGIGGGAGMMGGAPGTMGGTAGGGTMGGGMMGGAWTTASYLDSLKTELGITAKQLPAWNDYAETVSGLGVQMQGLHQTMFEAMGTASWQERRAMMNQMFQAQQQAFGAVHDAANKLLQVLDPAQRAQAQRILPGFTYGPGMMGGR